MDYKPSTIQVNLPTDNGFIGRECQNNECNKYFKVDADFESEKMYCPYCATDLDSEHSITKDQYDFIMENAEEEALNFVGDLLVDMLEKSFKNSSTISVENNSKPKKVVKPKYSEKQVDSEIKCPKCDLDFQVYGIFGYCPGCKNENIIIYDANIAIILREIRTSNNPERQLRHAYNDLVSTFESFCKKKSFSLDPSLIGRFQGIYDAKKFFKKHHGIDILEGIEDDAEIVLRKVFGKRHLYSHNRGFITEKYVLKVPEDKMLLGEKAKLTMGEFTDAASAIRKLLEKLI